LLDSRILPAFYKKQLDKISNADILRFIQELRKIGMRMDGKDTIPLSDASVQMHYKLLRSILNKAVQWKYLSQNPCSLIVKEDIPKANYRRLPIWQENDFNQLEKQVGKACLMLESALNSPFQTYDKIDMK